MAHHGPADQHAGPAVDAWLVHDTVVVGVVAALAVGYGAARWGARTRGPWPVRRTACWYAGVGCVAVGLVGPLADAAHTSFTGHMAAHVLVGMLGPLLLVLGGPVTLALRALPVRAARAVTRVLRTGYVRAVSHPVTAGTLNAGGLWLLYTTDLVHLMHGSALVHGAVHAHMLLAGYLFTASIVGVDPDPHRASVRLRAGVLIAFIAAHSMLSKWVYAHPPAGVDAAEARVGAQLMYYAGDAVDVTLVVLLLAGWYAATRPPGAGTSTRPGPLNAVGVQPRRHR